MQASHELLRKAAERGVHYVEDLNKRRVSPDKQAVRRIERLNTPLPEEPSDPEAVLEELDAFVSPATMAMAGPRFFGFVTGGSLPVALASNWLAGAWNQNTAYYEVAPATAFLEQVALGWLIDIFKLPKQCGGAFVTGSTMANFCGLAAARHSVLTREGWNVEANGLFGAPPINVVVGEEAHPSVFKSLGLLGLGRERVTRVPVDSQGRMRLDTLPHLSGPSIVCVQAGNVNTGAFDPTREICERLHREGGWVHVDGAFGLWAAAAPSRAYLTDGIAEADSWATDAHKWLNVPYDCGIVFVLESEALRSAMETTAAYLPSGEKRNPSDYTPELSRRSRGVEVWAALRALGRSGLSELVDRTCKYAKRFAEELEAAGYEVLNDVVLNQVLVSFGDPQTTERVIADIQADGTCWCGSTVWQGHTAMRISVSSWSTTESDVEQSLKAILRIAAKNAALRAS